MKSLKKITLFILMICSIFAVVCNNKSVSAEYEQFYRATQVNEKNIFDKVH